MASWGSLAVALAFGIAGVHSGPCKPATVSHGTAASSFTAFETQTQSAIVSTTFLPETYTTSAFEDSTTEIWNTATSAPSESVPSSSATSEVGAPSPTIVSEAQTTSTIEESTTVTTEYWTSTTQDAPVTSSSQAAPKPPLTNMLQNPGFEDFDGVSYSGSPWIVDQGQSAIIHFGESATRTGAAKVFISLENGVPKLRQLVSSFRVGQPYTLSAWYAYAGGNGDDTCQIGLMVGDQFIYPHYIVPNGSFGYVKIEGTVTALEHTALVGIYLTCPNGYNVDVLVDDVSLTWDNEYL